MLIGGQVWLEREPEQRMSLAMQVPIIPGVRGMQILYSLGFRDEQATAIAQKFYENLHEKGMTRNIELFADSTSSVGIYQESWCDRNITICDHGYGCCRQRNKDLWPFPYHRTS